MNTVKTMVLMVGLTVLLVLVGGGLVGTQRHDAVLRNRHGHEPGQLLVQRQDRPEDVRRQEK